MKLKTNIIIAVIIAIILVAIAAMVYAKHEVNKQRFPNAAPWTWWW